MLTWTPLVCFAIILLVFCVSEWLSSKTNGYISAMVFAAVIALALFWTNLIPKTVAVDSTLITTLTSYGVALLIVNMGTSIDFENLISEWKTVLICCAGLVGLGILAFTAGVALFGKEYALCAAPPISGGVIAYQIVAEVATAAGRLDLAGYAALIMGLQSLIGMPVSSFCLKKELAKMKAENRFSAELKTDSGFKLPETNLFKDPKGVFDSSTYKFFKLAFAAIIATVLSNLTGGILNVNVAYLLVGVVLRKVNFLQKNMLQSAGGYGICMMAMYALVFNGFSGVSPADFLNMIVPILGMFALGVIGIGVMAAIVGKFVGYSPAVAIAVGMTALYGYPGTEILSKEVVSSMKNFTEEEKAKALDYVMPKMIVGGFTTVTVASVVFAGIIAPMIF